MAILALPAMDQSGAGLPGVFPPLKDNEVVLEDDPTEHIQTIVNGLQGKNDLMVSVTVHQCQLSEHS